MAKENPHLNGLEALYKKSYLDTALYNWVEAQRSLFRAVTIEQSIDLFCRHYDISDTNTDSLKITYSRMQREYFNTKKDATKGAK